MRQQVFFICIFDLRKFTQIIIINSYSFLCIKIATFSTLQEKKNAIRQM